MNPEGDVPKKRGRKKKIAPASEEILEILEDSSAENIKPKTKKTTRKAAETITIPVKHTKTISVKRGGEEKDPFAILDKELEFQEFFKKFDTQSALKPQAQESKVVNQVQEKQFVVNEQSKPVYKEIATRRQVDTEIDQEIVTGKGFWRYFKWPFVLVLLVGIVYAGYTYVYPKYFVKSPLDEIRRLAIVPESEQPSLYVVGPDAAILKNPLFKGVKIGDKVFIFEKNAMMYVYRDAENKLVSIVPIDFEAEKPEVTPAVSTSTAVVSESASTTTAIQATSTKSTTATSTKATTTSTKVKTATTTKK